MPAIVMVDGALTAVSSPIAGAATRRPAAPASPRRVVRISGPPKAPARYGWRRLCSLPSAWRDAFGKGKKGRSPLVAAHRATWAGQGVREEESGPQRPGRSGE